MDFEESQINLTATPVTSSLCRKKLFFFGIGLISVIIILSIILSVEYGHQKNQSSIYFVKFHHLNQLIYL